MKAQDVLDMIIAERQRLQNVSILCDEDSNEIKSIKFRFDSAIFLIVVNPDDDTILLSLDDPTHFKSAQWKNAPEILLAALGKRVQWYWQLQNHQGYWDAAQIEFAKDIKGEITACVQIVAIASRLSIREVKPEDAVW